MCKNNQQETVDNQSGISKKRDTYILSYTFWTSALFFLIFFTPTIHRAFRVGIFIIPIIGILTLIWVIIMLINLGKNIFRRRLCRAFFIIIIPFIIGIFLNILTLLDVTDRVRLEYNRSSYMKAVSQIQVMDNSPRLKIWYWGEDTDFSLPGGSFHYLIYDDSDQILLPSQSRSANWKQSFGVETRWELSSDNDWQGNCRIKRLDGHFYLLTITI